MMDVKEACREADIVSQIERKEAGLDKTNPEYDSHIKKPGNNTNDKKENCINNDLFQLDKLVKGCFGDDEYVQIECCSRIRKLLCEKDPPIDQVVKTGVVPRLVQFLLHENNPKLQFEAEWVLSNIACGKSLHTHVVAKNGAIPHLIKLMLSNHKDVAEQAVWALGNIAGDSTQYRDFILSQGGLTNLRQLEHRCFGVINATIIQNGWRIEQLVQDPQMLPLIGLLRNMAWTLGNFFGGLPQTNIKYAESGIKPLTVMLAIPDSEILENAARAFYFLTYRDDEGDNINQDNIKNDIINTNNEGEEGEVHADGDEHVQREGEVSIEKGGGRDRQREGEREGESERAKDGNIRSYNDKIKFMKRSGALLGLIQCLGYGKTIKDGLGVRLEALRALGRIASGDDKVTQYLVDLGICDSLLPLLDLREYENKNKNENKLLKETCWVISNITAGTHEQINKVIEANLFPSLINLLDKAPFKIRKEALWAVRNATCSQRELHIRYLVDRGVIHSMMNLLECNNSEILLTVMHGLNNILKCGEDIKNAENSKIEENEFKCYVENEHGLDKVKCTILLFSNLI